MIPIDPNLLWSIPLLPLAGFLINGTLGRKFPRVLVSAIALLFTAIPAGIVALLWSKMLAAGAPESFTLASAPWIQVTGLTINFAFTVDHLTLIMLGVVTGVGFLIHLYSVGYMAHEDGYWRFFAYLNLFMFFMLVLVLSSSFLLLFVGWEGVGLASYLLIGFYFKKKSAADAGRKAFVVNRIGDFGFLLAMFLLIAHFGSLDFAPIFASIAQHPDWQSASFLTVIALCLVLGATGKSAQIPLYVWLPDAMEGPTPVSALIHAATMVTAGIYMVARCGTLFNRAPAALVVVAVIGAATAIFAASIGLVQHDIKRVLAYSTVSQLGYMFLACGVGAYTAGVFHLLTHAFFKALLFLAAGSVIHALSGEQDMRNMGGLRKRIPVTCWTMFAGVYSIAGLPLGSGFFSKDEILYQVFISPNPLGKLLWFVGLVTAGMTSFYMFRLWFKTFCGESRFEEATDHAHHGGDSHGHSHGVHESPWIMTLPLAVLALLSIIGGWVGIPYALGGRNEIEEFLQPVFPYSNPYPHQDIAFNGLELGLAITSVVVALLGFYLAYILYYKKPGTATSLALKAKGLYNTLDHKYWVDEIYASVIVAPLLMATRIVEFVVDTGVVNGSAGLAAATSRGFSKLTRRQISGNIRSYAGWLAVGAAVILVIMTYGRGLWGHS